MALVTGAELCDRLAAVSVALYPLSCVPYYLPAIMQAITGLVEAIDDLDEELGDLEMVGPLAVAAREAAEQCAAASFALYDLADLAGTA